MKIEKSSFGQLPTGEPVIHYQFTRSDGSCLGFINYGGIVTNIGTPNKQGAIENVVLGFETLQPYLDPHPYFGALIGRFSNRIQNGTFSINGHRYHLEQNNLGNHLHGGKGFDKKIWEVEEGESKILLRLLSPDGDDGYPGNLSVSVEYEFTEDLSWHIRYQAETDRETVINLTNHSYFNLAGNHGKHILDHELKLHALHYIPTNETLIPLDQKFQHVEATPFDFLTWKKIGLEIDAPHDQLKNGGGYDHCWVGSAHPTIEPILMAEVRESGSGRALEVWTTQPGVQFFSGNYGQTFSGEKGESYPPRSGFCLETQHFPNAPNRPDYPTTLLKPGEMFQSETVYKFSV